MKSLWVYEVFSEFLVIKPKMSLLHRKNGARVLSFHFHNARHEQLDAHLCVIHRVAGSLFPIYLFSQSSKLPLSIKAWARCASSGFLKKAKPTTAPNSSPPMCAALAMPVDEKNPTVSSASQTKAAAIMGIGTPITNTISFGFIAASAPITP